MTQQSPIGVFDSGVGGLSIAKTINTLMPNEDLIYIADHLYSPYGNKSTETLQQRTSLIVDYFIKRGCKAIVVACNTATVHTIAYLRKLTNIPIIGVEPALKPASEMSQSGSIGLLATEQTIKSDSFLLLKSRFDQKVDVNLVACPSFVELVEQGQLNTPETRQVVKGYISELISNKIDYLVLGCTHYAFLIPSIDQCIAEMTNQAITIIEPSYPVCLELQRQLAQRSWLNQQSKQGNIEFYSTIEQLKTSSQSPFVPEGNIRTLNGLFSLLWQQPAMVNYLNFETHRPVQYQVRH